MTRYRMAVHFNDYDSEMIVEVKARNYNFAVEFLEKLFDVRNRPDIWFVGEEME